jgi:hypothetical protein
MFAGLRRARSNVQTLPLPPPLAVGRNREKGTDGSSIEEDSLVPMINCIDKYPETVSPNFVPVARFVLAVPATSALCCA